MSHVSVALMRNISQFAVSMVLLTSQVHLPGLGDVTAAAQSSTSAASVYEVKLNTNTSAPIEITAPNKPDYEAEVLAPLREAQAKAAVQAAAAAAAQAAQTKLAASRIKLASQKVALIPGSHTDWMKAAGIAESDYGYVEYIIDHESGWGVTKSNYSGSGAYGLGQALPASKMAPYGADYLTDPITQLRWAQSYAVGRYGSWANAYSYWTVRHNW